MKFRFSLAVSIIMIISMLFMVGCASAATSGAPTVVAETTAAAAETTATAKAPVTLTVAGIFPVSWNDYPDSLVAKYFRDNLGITFNVIDISDRKDAMMASGSLPDVFIIENSEYRPLIQSGFILPLDDLIAQYGPNISSNQGLMDYMRVSMGDGKNIYGLTNYSEEQKFSGLGTQAWGLNVDWQRYAQLGYPEINANIDEIYELLVDMVKLKPKTDKGLTVYGSNYPTIEMRGQSLYGCNTLGEYPLQSYISVDCATGTLTKLYTDADGPIWEMNRLYYMLNQVGLLDPDSMMGDFDTNSLKSSNGQYVSGFYYDIMGNANKLFAKEGVANGFQFIPLKGMAIWGGFNYPYGQNMRCFAASAKEPERIMEFFNLIYSAEGSRVLSSGLEGVTYDYSDGVPTLREDVGKAYLNSGDDWAKYGIGICNAGILVICKDGYSTNLFSELDFIKRSATPMEKSVEEHYGMTMAERVVKMIEDGQVTDFGKVRIDVNNTLSALPDDLNRILNDVDTLMIEGTAKCALAPDIATYTSTRDSLIAKVTEMGIDKVYDWYITNYNKLTQSK